MVNKLHLVGFVTSLWLGVTQRITITRLVTWLLVVIILPKNTFAVKKGASKKLQVSVTPCKTDKL